MGVSGGKGGGLGINPRTAGVLQKQHTRPDILLLPTTDLALAIEIPDRLGEQVQHVRTLRGEDVVDVVRRDDVGLAAFQRARDAQEADEVGVVCVEELPTPSPTPISISISISTLTLTLTHPNHYQGTGIGAYLAFVR
jgi:hypothetical protein